MIPNALNRIASENPDRAEQVAKARIELARAAHLFYVHLRITVGGLMPFINKDVTNEQIRAAAKARADSFTADRPLFGSMVTDLEIANLIEREFEEQIYQQLLGLRNRNRTGAPA